MKDRAILFLIIWCLAGYAYPAWHVKTEIDKMSDKKTRIASLKNNDSVFVLYEESPGVYVGALIITKPFLQIYFDPKIIEVRVDKNPLSRLDMTNWEPRRAYFYIPIKLLDEMYSGHKLLVQFPYSSTQSVVEEYRLTGTIRAFKAALTSYKPKSAREKAAVKEIQQQNAYNNEQQNQEEKNAVKNCPEAWAAYLKEEKDTGRPQIWRGCPD